MAKIYYRRYKERIDAGEITLDEAIALAAVEVPVKWRADVIARLEADRPVDPEPEPEPEPEVTEGTDGGSEDGSDGEGGAGEGEGETDGGEER